MKCSGLSVVIFFSPIFVSLSSLNRPTIFTTPQFALCYSFLLPFSPHIEQHHPDVRWARTNQQNWIVEQCGTALPVGWQLQFRNVDTWAYLSITVDGKWNWIENFSPLPFLPSNNSLHRFVIVQRQIISAFLKCSSLHFKLKRFSIPSLFSFFVWVEVFFYQSTAFFH